MYFVLWAVVMILLYYYLNASTLDTFTLSLYIKNRVGYLFTNLIVTNEHIHVSSYGSSNWTS